MNTDTSVLQAFRLVVKHIGGWEKAAALCGDRVTPDAMRLAWSGDRRYSPNAIDAEIVTEYAITNDTPHCRAYVNEVAKLAGGFVALPVRDDMPHDARDSAARLTNQASSLQIAILDALSDGQLTTNERKALRPVLLSVIERFQQVAADLECDDAERGVRRVA